MKQLKELELNESVVIDGKKKDIEGQVKKLSGKYLVTKVSYNKCVVVLVEDAESFTQQLYRNLESIKPFEKKEFEFESIEYVRSLVSSYNKQNNRHFKVNVKDGITSIREPFEMIEVIDPENEQAYNEAFKEQMKNKVQW